MGKRTRMEAMRALATRDFLEDGLLDGKPWATPTQAEARRDTAWSAPWKVGARVVKARTANATDGSKPTYGKIVNIVGKVAFLDWEDGTSSRAPLDHASIRVVHGKGPKLPEGLDLPSDPIAEALARDLGEAPDAAGVGHLGKLLASMDARAASIRADLNDLAREALAVAEDAGKVGADEDFWREFRSAAKGLVKGFAHVAEMLQRARETVGYEPEEGMGTVTEGPGGAAPEAPAAKPQGKGQAAPAAPVESRPRQSTLDAYLDELDAHGAALDRLMADHA